MLQCILHIYIYTFNICVNFVPINEIILSINDASLCFYPTFPPLFFSLLLLRSGALYATSKVEFPQTDTIFQGAKNVKGLTEGHVDLEKNDEGKSG